MGDSAGLGVQVSGGMGMEASASGEVGTAGVGVSLQAPVQAETIAAGPTKNRWIFLIHDRP